MLFHEFANVKMAIYFIFIIKAGEKRGSTETGIRIIQYAVSRRDVFLSHTVEIASNRELKYT